MAKVKRIPTEGTAWDECGMSKSAFFTTLRSDLRRLYSKSRLSGPRNMALKKAKLVQKGTDIRGVVRDMTYYTCADCKEAFRKVDVGVDHISPCGSLKGYEDVGEFIKSLFCAAEDLQVLCKSCHDIKTYMERTGQGRVEACASKATIKWLKDYSVVEQKDELLVLGVDEVFISSEYKRRAVRHEIYFLEFQEKAIGDWTMAKIKAESMKGRIVYGDLWDMDGIKIVSTNLGGVHGRGLAKQARDMNMINSSNKDFDSSDMDSGVICIAVKGKAPETAKIKGKAFSERVVDGNFELMKDELRKLIRYARKHREINFYLPYIGLGFGEGRVEEILPILELTTREPNIKLVAKTSDVMGKYPESFKRGVRYDKLEY